MKSCIIAFVLTIVGLTGCASTPKPEPAFACGVRHCAVAGRGDVLLCDTSTSSYVSGMRETSCSVKIPCSHLTSEQQQQVPRCQRWEDRPFWERVLLHVIYLQ